MPARRRAVARPATIAGDLGVDRPEVAVEPVGISPSVSAVTPLAWVLLPSLDGPWRVDFEVDDEL